MLRKILDSVELYFYKIENQIKEIQSYSFVSKSYELLIKMVKNYKDRNYDHFTNNMESIRRELKEKEIDDFTLNRDYYDKITWYFKSFIIFDFILSLFKNSYSMSIPQGNFIFIKEISLNIKNSELIIFPYHHRQIKFNYGYKNISKLLEFKNEESKEDNKKIEEFHSFLIPYFNQEDILTNCALAHEYGHLIEKKQEISKTIKNELVKKKVLDKKEIEDILKKEKPHISEEDWKDRIKYDKYMNPFNQSWRKQCESWIEEIISDIIGVRVLGLAFFFSFIEILLLKKTVPEKKHDEYPPNWLRIKYMIKEIKNYDLENLIIIDIKTKEEKQLGNFLRKRIEFIENELCTENKPSLKELDERTVKIIDSVLVQNLIDERIKNMKDEGLIKDYTYSKIDIKEIISIIELLDEYITPNEIINKDKTSTPASIISILNAGWFYYLYNIKNHYELFEKKEDDYQGKAEIVQKLNNLLLKAIELSKIQENVMNKRSK